MSNLTKENLIHIFFRFCRGSLPKVFIETGTFQGETINRVQSLFPIIHTFELNKELYEKVCVKFQSQNNIHLYFGSSVKGLGQILPSIKEPAVFWLDAHYSGPNTACGEQEVPLLAELEVISKRVFKDIILIDDKEYFGQHGKYSCDSNYKSFNYDWRNITIKNILRSLVWKFNYILIDYDQSKLIIFTNLSTIEVLRLFIIRELRAIKHRLYREA